MAATLADEDKRENALKHFRTEVAPKYSRFEQSECISTGQTATR
jgi:hypothetical protein